MLYQTSSGSRLNFGTDFHCYWNITLEQAEMKQHNRLANLSMFWEDGGLYFVNGFPSRDGCNFHQNSYTTSLPTKQNVQNATVLT